MTHFGSAARLALVWATTLACSSTETPGASAPHDAEDGASADLESADASAADAGELSDTRGEDAADSVGSDAAAPDTGDPSDAAELPDTAPPELTWAERFERVIPPTGVLPLALDFADGDWAALLAAWTNTQVKQELPAALTYGDVVMPAVGVRLKGLNSLQLPQGEAADPTGKYPLKIDFNSQGGDRLYGVDEVRLNNGYHDPTQMRDWLTAEMYRAMGVRSAHIGYADVTIEGAHVGLYALSQSVDKQFLKERYGTADGADDGNLYKCVYNGFGACSLAWRGDAKSDYVATEGCAEGYDACGLVLKTNEDDPAHNDYADLIAFLKVLHETPDAELPEALPKVFDVEQFLRLSAVAFATGNDDSYFGKGHNYYLYRRSDGRFEMIPWDFDLAYGGGCETPDFEPTCGGLDGHPLVARILAVPAWRARYRELLCEVATQWMTLERHSGWITALHARIGAFMATDPNPSPQGSYAAQTSSAGGGDGNLYDFVSRRVAYLAGTCTPDE